MALKFGAMARGSFATAEPKTLDIDRGSDGLYMGMASHSSRLMSQLRVMQTQEFVPAAAIVRQIRTKVQRDPYFERLRAVADTSRAQAAVEPGLDVAQHVRETRLDQAALEDVANSMMARDLPSGRMWEIESFTDGVNSHGVIFRWNHWLGDGLSTQRCIGRLFSHPFEEPASVQSRVGEERRWGSGWRAATHAARQAAKEPRSTWFWDGARDATDFVDSARVLFMPVADLSAVKAAAKAEETTVTAVLLCAAARTHHELCRKFRPRTVQSTCGVKIAFATHRHDALCNQHASFQVDMSNRASLAEVGQTLRGAVVDAVAALPAVRSAFDLAVRNLGARAFASALLTEALPERQAAQFMLTSFPGPSQAFSICGVPVTSYFATRGDILDRNFTCFTYDGRLYVTLTVPPRVYEEAEHIRAVWSRKLKDVCNMSATESDAAPVFAAA